MSVERQQGEFYQPFLFEDWQESPRPDQGGKARSQSARSEEPQAFAASDPARALTVSLMEEVTDLDNLNRAHNAWFEAQGLVNPLSRYLQLQH